MRTRENLSEVIAGCMTWGAWGRQMNTNQMERLMHQCLELGITTFDHADIYGGYTTESDFGKAFQQSSISRTSIRLISKCGIQYVCEARQNRIKHYNYSEDYILESVHISLRNLKTDYLDILLLHRPSPLMDPEEISRAFERLRQEGKVKQFGVSNFTPSQVALLAGITEIEFNQISCSLTDMEALYNGVLDDCLQHSRIPMAWSPLGSYFREENDQNIRLKKALNRLREKYDATESQLLLAWLYRHPSGIIPVVGTTRKERLQEAVEALKIDLETEDWFELVEASQGHKVP